MLSWLTTDLESSENSDSEPLADAVSKERSKLKSLALRVADHSPYSPDDDSSGQSYCYVDLLTLHSIRLRGRD